MNPFFIKKAYFLFLLAASTAFNIILISSGLKSPSCNSLASFKYCKLIPLILQEIEV